MFILRFKPTITQTIDFMTTSSQTCPSMDEITLFELRPYNGGTFSTQVIIGKFNICQPTKSMKVNTGIYVPTNMWWVHIAPPHVHLDRLMSCNGVICTPHPSWYTPVYYVGKHIYYMFLYSNINMSFKLYHEV